MKLLIITQKMDKNDPILGFFHRWVIEFAEKCEKVTVICLEKGEYSLPGNVKILSLGKEASNFQFPISNFQSISNFSIFKKLKYLWRFYKYIWKLRKDYDSVFVHMNPEYVVLGGLFWELWRKKIFLWYTHKSVNLWLRLADNLADKIFTASKKSFRLTSDKVEIVGHGIDIDKFKNSKFIIHNSKFIILTAGRVSEVKNIHLLVEVAEILKKKDFSAKGGPASGWEIQIAGEPILDKDKVYFEKLKNLIREKKLEDKIIFVGSKNYDEIEKFYQQGDLFVNFSETGSLDKAVLEAMSCGLDVLVSNEAFFEMLPNENIIRDLNPENVAGRIKQFIDNVGSGESNQLRVIVTEKHNIKSLIGQLCKDMS